MTIIGLHSSTIDLIGLCQPQALGLTKTKTNPIRAQGVPPSKEGLLKWSRNQKDFKITALQSGSLKN